MPLTADAPEVTLTLTTEISRDGSDGERAYADELDRQSRLLRSAEVECGSPVVQHLTLAADQFIVERQSAATPGAQAPRGAHSASVGRSRNPARMAGP